MNIQHTPTPWAVELHDADPGIPRSQGGGRKVQIYGNTKDATGITGCVRIATVSRANVELPITKANAAFIVRACNSHDELLEACKRVEYFFQNITDSYKGPNYAEAFKAVSSAIAKAEGR